MTWKPDANALINRRPSNMAAEPLAPARPLSHVERLAARLERAGATPVDMIVRAMHEAWASADTRNAVEYAKAAAPYMHMQRKAVELSGPDGGAIPVRSVDPTQLSDSTLDELMAARRALAAPTIEHEATPSPPSQPRKATKTGKAKK